MAAWHFHVHRSRQRHLPFGWGFHGSTGSDGAHAGVARLQDPWRELSPRKLPGLRRRQFLHGFRSLGWSYSVNNTHPHTHPNTPTHTHTTHTHPHTHPHTHTHTHTRTRTHTHTHTHFFKVMFSVHFLILKKKNVRNFSKECFSVNFWQVFVRLIGVEFSIDFWRCVSLFFAFLFSRCQMQDIIVPLDKPPQVLSGTFGCRINSSEGSLENEAFGAAKSANISNKKASQQPLEPNDSLTDTCFLVWRVATVLKGQDDQHITALIRVSGGSVVKSFEELISVSPSIDWSIALWFFYWPSSVYWLIDWSIVLLTHSQLIDRLIDWLIDWLIDSFSIVRLIDWLTHSQLIDWLIEIGTLVVHSLHVFFWFAVSRRQISGGPVGLRHGGIFPVFGGEYSVRLVSVGHRLLQRQNPTRLPRLSTSRGNSQGWCCILVRRYKYQFFLIEKNQIFWKKNLKKFKKIKNKKNLLVKKWKFKKKFWWKKTTFFWLQLPMIFHCLRQNFRKKNLESFSFLRHPRDYMFGDQRIGLYSETTDFIESRMETWLSALKAGGVTVSIVERDPTADGT